MAEMTTGQRCVGWIVVAVGILLSWWLGHLLDFDVPGWYVLWPSLMALIFVFATRSAFVGLLTGAFCGAFLLYPGGLVAVVSRLLQEQFVPMFSSPWKLSAIGFTLILSGFVALVEAGGGLQALVRRLLGGRGRSAKRMQMTVFGFGLLVFFDGLANTMLIGRLLRSAADRCGVSRVKLAYLADTTGSAVACVAFISTWIAFQLAMIRAGYEAVGLEVSAYAVFFKSLPMNFYCWFALALALVSVVRNYNPGPMGRFEREAVPKVTADTSADVARGSHWLLAIVPILVLTFSIPVISYCVGVESLLPFSLDKFAAAYAVAESHVPMILVGASVVASVVAGGAYLFGSGSDERQHVLRVFGGGVWDLLGPVCILLAAWMLGGVISALGAADVLSALLSDRVPLAILPVGIFCLGALISFSTGTSWGTMGVLMPLAIPVVFQMSGEIADVERDRMIAAAVGAVFSGAVFGDHCSPFSDTTIVASIAAGVEPLDHVRTQLPFAGIAAVVSIVVGFVPLGMGLPAWVCLLLGVLCLCALPGIKFLKYGNSN